MVNQDCQNIIDRIKSLRAEGQSGIQIARILHKEGCDLGLVRDAFYEERYVVSIERLGELQILHVSDKPEEAGLMALLMSAEPRALPEIAWR